MNKLEDLQIQKEVLPLFDYTLNSFAQKQLLEQLLKPLSSIENIEVRQEIFKGFLQNLNALSAYSYTVLYVNEVHSFLNEKSFKGYSKKKLRFKLLRSSNFKITYRGQINQMILFFHRLEHQYFKRIKKSHFPSQYAEELDKISEFLAYFQTEKYEAIIRESQLKTKDLVEISDTIHLLKQKELIHPFWDRFFLFEAYLSLSLGIQNNEFTFPQFDENRFELEDFYHPILDRPIKNSLTTKSKVIVLNGPNMSGKSTFLKAVGLCIYLAHLGVVIPARKAILPFFDHFSFAINKRDDLLNGYSHFMTEIKNLKSVVELASAGERCFGVLDELFSGTNLEDGLEICKTTITGLAKFESSFFLLSTHIQELKEVAQEGVEHYHIDCQLIDNKPTFTYQLKEGWSDVKVGRILFEKEGLNKLLSQSK